MIFWWFSTKIAKTIFTQVKLGHKVKLLLLLIQYSSFIETSEERSLCDSLKKNLKRHWPDKKQGHWVKLSKLV